MDIPGLLLLAQPLLFALAKESSLSARNAEAPDLTRWPSMLKEAIGASDQAMFDFASKLRKAQTLHANEMPTPDKQIALPTSFSPTAYPIDVPPSWWSRPEATRARLVYMRIVNRLWDAATLPLPYVAFPRYREHDRFIPRYRIGHALRRLKPLILQQLATRVKNIHALGLPAAARSAASLSSGCLEWGVTYSKTVFGDSVCPKGRINILRYEASADATSVLSTPASELGGSNHGYYRDSSNATYNDTVIRADLCRRPLDASLRRHVEVYGGFELALITDVFEHLAEPFVCMSNLFQLVAPGGLVVLTVPFSHPYHPAPSDYFRYTAPGLQHVATSAGFEVLRCFPVGSRREAEAQNAGFWVAALPPRVFDEPADAKGGFYQQVVALVRRPYQGAPTEAVAPAAAHATRRPGAGER